MTTTAPPAADTDGTPAPDATTAPPAPDTTPPPANGDGTPPPPAEGEPEGDRRLRNEARNLRERLKTEAAERERIAAELDAARGEASTAAERAAAVETELRELRLEAAVARAAGQHNIADPVAAARLIDRDKVAFGDDGRPDPDSVADALAAMVKAHPILVRAGNVDAAATGNGGGNVADMNALLRARAGRAAG